MGLVKFLAPRWKAVVGLLVPLIGGLITLSSTNTLDAGHIWGLVATALTTAGVVHQTPNQAPDASSDVPEA
jgi:hypothetical protein